MQLYYFKDPLGNFGDDLNPWLWNQLLPGLLDGSDDELFVGIGTLLNHRIPQGPVKHVFGSGFGYGELPKVDERWQFHAVRGFETARALGLPAQTAITDAAVLIRTVPVPKAERTSSRFGFIPHCQSSRDYDWAHVARDLGWHYIDAQWDVERVLLEMSRCETLICEAMHGAIAADTLRIPWIPVACYDDISAFKWRDWLSTLELPYEPHRVTSLYDVERDLPSAARAKNAVKRGLRHAGLWSAQWTEPPPPRTGAGARAQALQQLQRASEGRAYLSADAIVERHTERYSELVERFRRQLLAG